MSTPYIQQQNINKCPHGFPLGACPICNGTGGGVSRDKNKPRVKGEMSYNECLAVWRKMQAQKQEKLDKKEELLLRAIEKLRNIRELYTTEKILDKIIEPLPRIIQNPIKIVLLPIVNLVLRIPAAIKTIETMFVNISNFISSTAEKLSSLVGEAKNFIKGFFDNKKTAKKIKILLSLFVDKGLEEELERKKVKEIIEEDDKDTNV